MRHQYFASIGLSLLLFPMGVAIAQARAPVPSTYAMPDIDLRQYANTSVPTTISFVVDAQIAGGEKTADIVRTSAVEQLNGGGYQVTDTNAQHRITVQVTLRPLSVSADPAVAAQNIVGTATRAGVFKTLFPWMSYEDASKIGASDAASPSMVYTMVALVSVTIDGQQLPAAARVMVSSAIVGSLPRQDAERAVEELIGRKVASFFGGASLPF